MWPGLQARRAGGKIALAAGQGGLLEAFIKALKGRHNEHSGQIRDYCALTGLRLDYLG